MQSILAFQVPAGRLRAETRFRSALLRSRSAPLLHGDCSWLGCGSSAVASRHPKRTCWRASGQLLHRSWISVLVSISAAESQDNGNGYAHQETLLMYPRLSRIIERLVTSQSEHYS